MPADKGTAAGKPNPPASCVGLNPRGSSSRASGFPRVSTTIRSSTRSSSRAGKTDSNSARASRRPKGPTCSVGQTGERVAQLSRREHERDPLRQQAARHERQRPRRRTVEPLRVIDDSKEWLLLGGLGQQAEDRQSDQERIRRWRPPQSVRTRRQAPRRWGCGRRSISSKNGEHSC